MKNNVIINILEDYIIRKKDLLRRTNDTASWVLERLEAINNPAELSNKDLRAWSKAVYDEVEDLRAVFWAMVQETKGE